MPGGADFCGRTPRQGRTTSIRQRGSHAWRRRVTGGTPAHGLAASDLSVLAMGRSRSLLKFGKTQLPPPRTGSNLNFTEAVVSGLRRPVDFTSQLSVLLNLWCRRSDFAVLSLRGFPVPCKIHVPSFVSTSQLLTSTTAARHPFSFVFPFPCRSPLTASAESCS